MKTVHHLSDYDIKMAIDSYLKTLYKKSNVTYKVVLSSTEAGIIAEATEEQHNFSGGYKD